MSQDLNRNLFSCSMFINMIATYMISLLVLDVDIRCRIRSHLIGVEILKTELNTRLGKDQQSYFPNSTSTRIVVSMRHKTFQKIVSTFETTVVLAIDPGYWIG
jgi:hypothetical protein